MWISYLLVFGLLTCSLFCCSDNSDNIDLPFRKGLVWHYDVSGFMSLERYPASSLNRSDSLLSGGTKEIPERDTIQVFITEIDTIGKDSVLFVFSEGFARFWGKEILQSKDGYQKFYDYDEPSFLIKFPAKVNKSWRNRFPLVVENCTIIATDTTIFLDGHQYRNCIAIDIQQSLEGRKHHIQNFFSSDFGLVYYKDFDSSDEIKLIRMEHGN